MGGLYGSRMLGESMPGISPSSSCTSHRLNRREERFLGALLEFLLWWRGKVA